MGRGGLGRKIGDKVDRALDRMSKKIDEVGDEINRVFDEVLTDIAEDEDGYPLKESFQTRKPTNIKVHENIRVRLTRKQLMGLITGEHKSLQFKIQDGVSIRVEMKP